MMPNQRHPRSESMSALAACLAVMWMAFPVFAAVILTRRHEWLVLLPIAALVGAGYGKIYERRAIKDIVDRWITSVHDSAHPGP